MDDPKTLTGLLCTWVCIWPLLAIFVTPAVALWLDRTGRLDRILTRMQRNTDREEPE